MSSSLQTFRTLRTRAFSYSDLRPQWIGSARVLNPSPKRQSTPLHNGLAAVIYAPSTVTAKVADGAEVTIKADTRYPFEDQIRFTVNLDKPETFPLYLRIPGWCDAPTVSVPAICENWSSRFVYDPKSVDTKVLEAKTKTVRHPIHLAAEFKKLLDQELVNNRAELAERYGLSRARVTQLMKMLALPADIQEYLLSLDDEKEIRSVSERKLRPERRTSGICCHMLNNRPRAACSWAETEEPGSATHPQVRIWRQVRFPPPPPLVHWPLPDRNGLVAVFLRHNPDSTRVLRKSLLPRGVTHGGHETIHFLSIAIPPFLSTPNLTHSDRKCPASGFVGYVQDV